MLIRRSQLDDVFNADS